MLIICGRVAVVAVISSGLRMPATMLACLLGFSIEAGLSSVEKDWVLDKIEDSRLSKLVVGEVALDVL
jgi:hypothetical protein